MSVTYAASCPQMLSKVIRLKVGMEDFAVSGKARMSLRTLLNRPPVVGAMKVQQNHQKRRPHSPKHYVCPFVISCQRALTWALRVLRVHCTAAAVEPTNQLKRLHLQREDWS